MPGAAPLDDVPAPPGSKEAGAPAATALVAPAVCAWGFLIAKLAAAVLDLVGGAGAAVVPAFFAGFLGDAVVVGLLGVVALVSRGLPAGLGRVLARGLAGLGFVLGLYAVVNVYLVAGYGSPLTAAMLAYRKDADVAALWATGPLLSVTLALVVFVAGLVPVARLATRRARPRALRLAAAGLVTLAVLGGVAPLFDEDGAVRALGLDRNAVALLVTSSLPASTSSDVPLVPWDAPWPAPADPRFTAPVTLDTSRGRPRHVVIWLAESTGARHTSLYGAPAEATPRLEALKEHTLRFEHYAANSPISAKAIFGSLCGLYPLPEAAFEARTNPRIACPSLMETLTAQGYDAALFHGGYFAFTDKLAFLEERGFSLLLDGESIPDRDRWFTNGWGIDDAALVEHGLAWLDGRPDPDRPSLAVYIPLFPHYEYFLPPGVPRPFGDKALLDRYRNGVRYTDELFGRVVDEYARRGLLEDTLFVFLGDHGEAFEEHPRNKLHAGFLYEENVHAPLVFLSPRLFPTEQASERLGTHVDLAPTVLSLLGQPVPAGTQGQSLVAADYRYRPSLFGTWYPDPLLGLRDGERKYVVNRRTGVEELYDLARDPGERRNLAPAFPDVTRAYRARLLDFEARQRSFILEHQKKGAGFLDRTFASLEASVVDDDGRETPCARRPAPGGEHGERIVCGHPDVWLAIKQERVFNMDRRCVRVHPPPRGRLVLKATTSPPVRTLGIGLTDRARFARGTPLQARFAVTNASGQQAFEPFELRVDDRFESTSSVRTLGASSTVPGEMATLKVEIWSEKHTNRSACLTISP